MIKFRLYNKDLKKYYKEDVAKNLYINDLNNENNIAEQFTGLQDKNGVDIYVGDIVVTMSNLKGFVYFDKSNVSFRLKSNLDDYALTVDKVQRLEIIGNINENKELLE